MRLMNWGCGPVTPAGWVNVDLPHVLARNRNQENSVAWDILNERTLWELGTFDGIVSHHAICALPYQQLNTALESFYDLLKPGGVIRIAVPRILNAFEAYIQQDANWFPNIERSGGNIDEAFCNYLNWYSTNLSIFTEGRLCAYLINAGFKGSWEVPFGETFTDLPVITKLDNRPKESLIVEGIK